MIKVFIYLQGPIKPIWCVQNMYFSSHLNCIFWCTGIFRRALRTSRIDSLIHSFSIHWSFKFVSMARPSFHQPIKVWHHVVVFSSIDDVVAIQKHCGIEMEWGNAIKKYLFIVGLNIGRQYAFVKKHCKSAKLPGLTSQY